MSENKDMKDEFNAEEAKYILKGYLKDYTDAINSNSDAIDLIVGICSTLFFIILSFVAFFTQSHSVFLYVAIVGFSLSLLVLLFSYHYAIKHTAEYSRAVIKSIIYGTSYDHNCKKLVGWLNNMYMITFSLSIISTLLFVLINV